MSNTPIPYPNVPGLHSVKEAIYLRDEPLPLNRRIYAVAIWPFRLVKELLLEIIRMWGAALLLAFSMAAVIYIFVLVLALFTNPGIMSASFVLVLIKQVVFYSFWGSLVILAFSIVARVLQELFG